MRVEIKKKQRCRRKTHVRSKHRFTVLRISELNIKTVEEVEAEEKVRVALSAAEADRTVQEASTQTTNMATEPAPKSLAKKVPPNVATR